MIKIIIFILVFICVRKILINKKTKEILKMTKKKIWDKRGQVIFVSKNETEIICPYFVSPMICFIMWNFKCPKYLF